MALYDTDKNSEDRGNPSPNTHDTIIEGANKSHKTLSTHYTTDADTNTGRLQMQNKQILGNDGTTNTTLYGYNQALNQWGFFVVKTGTEVTTNTDLSKFIFNSNQDVFKIVSIINLSATVVMSATVGVLTTTTQPHGLSITPAYSAFHTIPASLYSDFGLSGGVNVPNPAFFYLPSTAGLGLVAYCQTSVDGTNVSFTAGIAAKGSGTYTFSAKVYLLQETAT